MRSSRMGFALLSLASDCISVRLCDAIEKMCWGGNIPWRWCVGVEVVVDEIEGICNAQKVVCVGFESRDQSHGNRKRETWRLSKSVVAESAKLTHPLSQNFESSNRKLSSCKGSRVSLDLFQSREPRRCLTTFWAQVAFVRATSGNMAANKQGKMVSISLSVHPDSCAQWLSLTSFF